MRTVELLERSLEHAQNLGYQVRHEWLGGSGGGACEFGGRKWLFVDLALTVDEQLEQVCAALRNDSAIYVVDIDPSVRRALNLSRVA
jgi:hypothetical protein